MLTRVAAWFGLLGGGLVNIELVLTSGRINFIWLLLFGLSARYFQRNGLLRPKQQQGDGVVGEGRPADEEPGE